MPIALFDLDGTLVDSNYHHALAWSRAFARLDRHPGLWRIHRALGMGGDQLVGHVTDGATERRHGDRLREWWQQEYDQLIGEVVPVDGAPELLAQLAGDGWVLVLASSSHAPAVERYVQLLGAADLVRGWTTADDAEQTKPQPDLVEAAMALVRDEPDQRAVMVGDAPWDVIAAARAGIGTVAVRSGGYGADELTEAGALAVVSTLAELPAAMRACVDRHQAPGRDA